MFKTDESVLAIVRGPYKQGPIRALPGQDRAQYLVRGTAAVEPPKRKSDQEQERQKQQTHLCGSGKTFR